MQDTLDEQESKPLDLQRYLDVVRRRYLYFFGALLVGWLIFWVASWILPATYKSGTLILVEQPAMPRDYVTPNVNEDVQGRLQNVTEQILSRTRLLRIIDQLHLYEGEESRKLTPDERVALMRKNIGIDLVRNPQDQITAFNIYYSSRDPHIAQRVASELTSLFINANLATRQQQSENTTKFLQSQLEAARQELAEQEAGVRKFKGAHVGDLPSQQATNLQILSGIQSQLQNEEDALNTAQQQRVYLQSLVSQYRTLQGTSKSTEGAPGQLAAIDQELEKLRSQLAELSSHYTDEYPDIRNTKAQITKTESRREQLIAKLKSKEGATRQPDSDGSTGEVENSLQNPALLQLQGQLQANQAEIASRQRAIISSKAAASEYQARLNEEPRSEQQLADLTRGYDQSKANYDDLLKKESESQMATSMEQMQQGERFRMLDPASLPLKPDSPNRLKLCGLGLAFGLVLGGAVVGGMEFLDDRLHSEQEIKTLLSMKVISEIPEVQNHSDQRIGKKRMLMGWAAAALVCATILAGTAISYLRG